MFRWFCSKRVPRKSRSCASHSLALAEFVLFPFPSAFCVHEICAWKFCIFRILFFFFLVRCYFIIVLLFLLCLLLLFVVFFLFVRFLFDLNSVVIRLISVITMHLRWFWYANNDVISIEIYKICIDFLPSLSPFLSLSFAIYFPDSFDSINSTQCLTGCNGMKITDLATQCARDSCEFCTAFSHRRAIEYQ